MRLSQGRKANGEGKSKPKGKAHVGAHRPLHPNPTRRCDRLADQCPHCHGDVTGVAQVAVQSYDRIEIPEIAPEVTRVTLHGGVCPCCARRFKAPPPAGLEPGSPFGPNLRAFVLYLRFGQAIPFERLERLMRDLFGLEISEGALVNLLEDSAPEFEVQTGSSSACCPAPPWPPTRPVSASARRPSGPGCFITPTAPVSSSGPRAARPWSGNSSASFVPSSGFPTVSRPRWAGRARTIRSASLTMPTSGLCRPPRGIRPRRR